MCASRSIIIVLLLITTWTTSLNCDEVSVKDSQACENFIQLFNQIPTLMITRPPPISEADLRELLTSVSNENKTIINDWSKISGDYNLKINGLKCTYKYVTMKMLYHLQTAKYKSIQERNFTILLYRKYTWRMLSVLFLARTTAPKQLWTMSAMLTAASQKETKYQELLQFMISNDDNRFLDKCVENNILPWNVLSETSSFSPNDYGNEVKDILVNLKLSDGNEDDMIGIYRYSQEFDVYGMYEKIMNSYKSVIPPGKFLFYSFYNQRDFSNALADCIKAVKITWKTDYSVILLFTDFVKNTLLMITSTLVLNYCLLPSNQLVQVDELYGRVPSLVYHVSKFLDMKYESVFQTMNTHLSSKIYVTRDNVNILPIIELYKNFTKKIGLKNYYIKNIFNEKYPLKNMKYLTYFSILLTNYCNIIKRLIKPLNFKTINYFELSMRSTSDEDI